MVAGWGLPSTNSHVTFVAADEHVMECALRARLLECSQLNAGVRRMRVNHRGCTLEAFGVRSWRVRISLILPGLVACAHGGAGPARGPNGLRECYQFDRAYFGSQLRSPRTGAFVYDTTAVVRLYAVNARPPTRPDSADRRPMLALFDHPDALVYDPARRAGLGVGAGYWVALGSDSLELSWSNGLEGAHFRLAIRHDGLDGTVVAGGDVIQSDPVTGDIAPLPSAPATAVGVPCPRGTGPA